MAQANAPRALPGEVPPFGRMLKDWRGLRRFSQLDLAMIAGTTQRHVSFIESGRARPSREMVLRLADALDAPLREHNGLLMAAGYAPAFRERNLSHPELKEVLQGLTLMLRQIEPHPAIAVDRCWNIIINNRAATLVFDKFVNMDKIWPRISTDGSRNILRLMFHPEGLRPYIRNWEVVAQATLARAQRRNAGPHDDVELTALLDEVRGYEDFPQRWNVPDWPSAPLPILPLEFEKDNVVLRFYILIATFGEPQEITLEELYIETFMPADAATQSYVENLIEPDDRAAGA